MKELRRRGRRLVCVAHAAEPVPDEPLFRDPGIELVRCDLSRPGWEAALAAPLAAAENVFHAAGEMSHRATCRGSRRVLEAVNVEATEKLYRLSARCRRFLFVSSIAVYGDVFPDPKDEAGSQAPADFYAETKRRAEAALRSSPRGAALLIVRPGIIYGEGDTNVVRGMIRFIERGLFVLPGGGTARRTLSAAPLVAEALAGLAEREPRDGVFNVADPASPTLRRLADDLAGLLGARRPRAMPAAACLLPAAFFSALQAAGVRNRLHLANLRRLTGSNPVDCGALRELLGPPKDHYAEALAADVRWHRATR